MDVVIESPTTIDGRKSKQSSNESKKSKQSSNESKKSKQSSNEFKQSIDESKQSKQFINKYKKRKTFSLFSNFIFLRKIEIKSTEIVPSEVGWRKKRKAKDISGIHFIASNRKIQS